MLKTSQVAEALNISSKTVLSIAKKIHIQPKKNDFGHYLFSEEDVLRMSEYVPQSSRSLEKKPTTSSKQEESLIERIDELERELRDTNYETIQYQLLIHRQEIEELITLNKQLKEQLEEVQKEILELKQPKHITIEEPRRKTSFFAFLFR